MRFAIVLLFIVGCKDKSRTEQPKPGSASAVVARTPDAATARVEQNTLRLPKLAGTPAVKTTKPIDKAKAEQLSKAEFEGFRRDVRIADDRGIDVRYITTARPRIMVSVSIAKCFDCIEMVAEKWKAKEDALKMIAGPDLKDRPDTTWAQGMTEISGTTYAWTYHVGHAVEKGNDGVAGAYGTAYALHYHDGVNMIRVVAEYKDDAPRSREDMIRVTPREDLEQIAKAFADHFVHAW